MIRIVAIFLIFWGSLAHADQVALLSDSRQAASAKFDAINNAESEIYFSSYIVRDDRTSRMLFAALKEAAMRNVRVFVIIDGFGNKSDRRVLAALARAGVHVELYKPKWFSPFGSYLNRMHDKLLVVDRKVLIHGDRNLGAEYFNYHSDLPSPRKKAFISREVIARGQVAVQAADYFRSLLVHRVTEAQSFSDVSIDDANVGLGILTHAFGEIPIRFLNDAREWSEEFVSAKADFFFDPPGAKGSKGGTYEAILNEIDSAKVSLLIENPYVVFTKGMREALSRAALRGVKITVLTNSVNSTDSVLVAGGWMDSREFLRSIGATAYEIKGEVLSTRERFKKLFGIASSKASLHSKTMVIDGRVVLITSFNLDPRSAYKNSEVAVKITSVKLARRLNRDIGVDIRKHARRVVAAKVLAPNAQRCGFLMRMMSIVLRSQI